MSVKTPESIGRDSPEGPSRWRLALMFALGAGLLILLYLLSQASQDAGAFSRLYSGLLFAAVLGVVVLTGLILHNVGRLIRQYRQRQLGSRLTVRLVLVFVLLAVAPVTLVYVFSLQALNQGIDSWFDVRVEQALDDALDLSRAALDQRMREHLRQTEQFAGTLRTVSDNMAAIRLHNLRTQGDVGELTLITRQGHVIASSTADRSRLVPRRPTEAMLLQLRQNQSFVDLATGEEGQLSIRVAAAVDDYEPAAEQRVLYAIYPVSARLSSRAESVQDAYAQYRELRYLRDPLKASFTLTLSLVLLLSLLAAVWGAFFSSRRLLAPLRDLSAGVQAVAAGDYDRQIPSHGRDELGALAASFNEMTRRVAQARDAERRSQQMAEAQRAYLEAVLGRLSSGVIVFDSTLRVRTANTAAGQILSLDPGAVIGSSLAELVTAHPPLGMMAETIRLRAERTEEPEWREEIQLHGASGRQVLMCRGTHLTTADSGSDHVVVFDDVTTLIQAQRDAAWGEVARRLAHEIKNPLTPIQLSAERLRRRLRQRLDPEDAQVLDRSVETIGHQVDAMKEMVRAFSAYSRSPQLKLVRLDLNRLVEEVSELYRGYTPGVRLLLRTEPRLPLLSADEGRMRQLLHNLLTNALEAVSGGAGSRVTISTRTVPGLRGQVTLAVSDDGPGIPEALLDHLFEPYVTSKPKGTGLGLAVVKKIVEEHGGTLQASNQPHGGASITVQLPAAAERDGAADASEHGRQASA